MKSGILAVSAVLFGLGFQSSATLAPVKVDSAKTVDRAVAYILQKGDAWIQERKCVSCHMIPGMVWSLSEVHPDEIPSVKDFGLRYRKVVEWTLKDALRSFPGSEGMGQILMADLDRNGVAETRPRMVSFARTLLQKQAADGSWAPWGQTPEQKRSTKEGREAVTMWAILALEKALGKEASRAIARGRTTLTGPEGKQSSEWHVLRYQVALQFKESSVANDQLQIILRAQNDDGGWGWVHGKESDAIATGQTLYALSFGRKDQVRSAATKAIGFLNSTQLTDGSWSVKGTLAHRQTVVIPTSVYWGTTWAVIGLSRWD